MARILSIEDSLTIRKMVEMILRTAGHEVLLADQGTTGLELARTTKPDLILLDYVLPDLPSTDICRQLLADPATADIPILLISTNGAAIRQLYAESRNVRDYLTKPFQAKVLNSVVEHLLAKRAAASGDHGSFLPTTDTAESEPQAPTAAPGEAAVAGEARAGVAGARTVALRTVLNGRFRSIAKMIPDLERRRGPLPAETFYLPFFLRSDLLAAIAAATGGPAEAAQPQIAGTHAWVGLDTTLLYLGRTAATGVFTLQLEGEVVTVSLAQGRVVMVGSDNPRAYCAGAAYNFRAVPVAAVANAVSVQQRAGVPFFITLCHLGLMPDPGVLEALLRDQGICAVQRALVMPGTRYSFVACEVLPEAARQFPLSLEMRQFVLSVLRLVDDWLEIESATGSVETVYAVVPEATEQSAHLVLSAAESAVLGLVDGQRSLQGIATAAGQELFGTCAATYRLLRLGMLRATAAPLAAAANPA
ncbi:MAG: response regulator [Opitutaceae bacterium]|nr:response regulator [Opitutaceae bacterium]